MQRQLFLERGFSLITVLVGTALTALVALIGSQVYLRFIAVEKQVDIDMALGEINRTILSRIDCQQTMTKNGRMARDSSCGQKALVLYDKDGRPLTGPVVASRGNSAPLGDGWYLQTLCQDSTQSLAIRAMKFTSSGAYAKDLNKRPLDAKHPKGLLFSGAPGKAALCMGSFEKKANGGLTVDLYDWSNPRPFVRSMAGANRPNAERREAVDQFCIFAGRELAGAGAINTPRCENTVHTYSGLDPCTFKQDATICTWDAKDDNTEFAISESYSGSTMPQRCYHVCFPRLP